MQPVLQSLQLGRAWGSRLGYAEQQSGLTWSTGQCWRQADADPQHLGSVAQWVVSQQAQPVPVVLVRNWQLQPEGPEQPVLAADEAVPPAAEIAAAARASARAQEAGQGEVISAAAAAAELMAATASRSGQT